MLRRYRPREVMDALERLGFVHDHTRGSHAILKKPGYTVSVPLGKLVRPGTFNSIARQAGMSGPELRDFIERG